MAEVEIRRMIVEDSDFVGRMQVEGFRSKFTAAVGESNLKGTTEIISESLRHQPKELFSRTFIALVNGERAGVCVIKIKDDPEPDDDEGLCYVCSKVGCRGCVGLCCMWCLMNNSVKRNACYLDNISVDGKFRGRGVGGALLKAADEEARNLGCHKIYLYVATDNRAKNLYERQGYAVVENTNVCCGSCIIGMSHFYKMEKHL